MKKHCKVLLLCLFLLSLFLPIRAYAHAGRTGVDGGHIDSETGEYHYHHGYPAHDHNDIDGDGIADCPYDFDDKTDHEFGNGGGATSNNSGIGGSDIPENNAKPSKTVWNIISTIFENLFLGIVIWISSSYFLSFFFFLIFGDDQGCSVSLIVGAAISIGVCIWLIFF
jgi:hypothetical protein